MTRFGSGPAQRVAELAKTYGDRLDEVAEFLAEFALQVRQLGPKGYLLSKAHRQGESVEDPLPEVEDPHREGES